MLAASRDLQQLGIEGDDCIPDANHNRDNVDIEFHRHDGLVLTATNTADSLFSSAEEGAAGPFTNRRDIHFMDSPKNHLSLSTEVCLFVYYSFVDTSNTLMCTWINEY